MVIYKQIEFKYPMDRGYGVEGESHTLHLTIKNNEIVEAVLIGIHFATEEEFEVEYKGEINDFSNMLDCNI